MTRITTKEQYEWAIRRVEELLPRVNDDTPRNDPASIELELISNLVADYSEEVFDIGEPSLRDVLRLRMHELGLSQKDLAKRIGIQASHLSEALNGKRALPTDLAMKIESALGLPAKVLLAAQTQALKEFREFKNEVVKIPLGATGVTAETENYLAACEEVEGDVIYSIEMPGATLFFFEEDWKEIQELFSNIN